MLPYTYTLYLTDTISKIRLHSVRQHMGHPVFQHIKIISQFFFLSTAWACVRNRNLKHHLQVSLVDMFVFTMLVDVQTGDLFIECY